MTRKRELSKEQEQELLDVLKARFIKNIQRHKNIDWDKVQANLEIQPQKLSSLYEMEYTGGEPDVVDFDSKTNEYVFFDCSAESPKGRRSLCYDREALDKRKENKPANSVMDMVQTMGVELMNEAQYRSLQNLGNFDTKTSSWLKTPENIRSLGGAIFGDYRYATVFVYHNGAESYYAARGFRGVLKV